MRYLLATIASLIVLFSLPVAADSLYLHGASYHYVNRHDGLNEVNYGLSYRWRNDVRIQKVSPDWLHVGAYENSNYDLSVFALTGYEHRLSRHLRVGYGAGVVAGYEFLPVAPAVIAYAEYQHVQVSVMPGVAVVSLRLDFDGSKIEELFQQ